MSYDVIIIGAGSAGLSFACSLSGHGLRIALVEKLSRNTLADPAFDGRDIAMTHRSVEMLKTMGAWARVPQKDISVIRHAVVMEGGFPTPLHFNSQTDCLGTLVSNHLIRKALYEEARQCDDVSFMDTMEVDCVKTNPVKTNSNDAEITLSDTTTLQARLVVAADSRFSKTRRSMGIPAKMRDFGRASVVCRMSHDADHKDIAYECFLNDRTLAVLPLSGKQSSVVVTLPCEEAEDLTHMPEDLFNASMEMWFEHRLGRMLLTSPRIATPLVAVYADRFHAQRFALIGDAAVGMHPVTAHGFNFGLLSQDTLAKKILAAHRNGGDIAAPALLADYRRKHRHATRPLYLATNALVELFTRTSRPAQFTRKALLTLGNCLPPARRMIVKSLTRTSE